MILDNRHVYISAVVGICFSLLTYTGTCASSEWNVFPKTDEELAALPPYCKSRFRAERESAEFQSWLSRMGSGFNHVHHYCAARHEVNMVNTEGYKYPKRSQEYLNRAIGQCEYVENHAGPDFILMPEVKVFKGDVLRRLDRDADAIKAYTEAMRLNKKYTPAYMRLADTYYEMGNKAEARKFVETGLEYSPNSKGLKRRLEKYK